MIEKKYFIVDKINIIKIMFGLGCIILEKYFISIKMLIVILMKWNGNKYN